jgi:beta-galactosidase
MVVVRANGEPGNIVLTASAEGIPATQIIIEVK